MTWYHVGSVQCTLNWVSVTVPIDADPSIVRIGFSFHGNSLRVYSRVFIRPVYDVGGDWVRGAAIRVFPDLDQQIIPLPFISSGVLRFLELKKGFRSWRWRNIPDVPHLIKVAFFVPE